MGFEFKGIKPPGGPKSHRDWSDAVVFELFGTGTPTAPGQVERLGGKGAHLAEMASMGLPVPPGFIITTWICRRWLKDPNKNPYQLRPRIRKCAALIKKAGKGPILFSVRSGAPVSMPGMMETILNVGMTRETLPKWTKRLGKKTAEECYERFLVSWIEVVLGRTPPTLDHLGSASGRIAFLENHLEYLGEKIPNSLDEQLVRATLAVFRSWNTDRAKAYRKKHGIPDDMGTAVVIQKMVFGNADGDSGSGVMFTRDPATGENRVVGEYLNNAQGEDLVAGKRTPKPLRDCSGELKRTLLDLAGRLEAYYRDMQDVEFVVERGTFWVLQTRNGKRTSKAAIRIATDLAEEGKIDRRTALSRIRPADLDVAKAPTLDESKLGPPAFSGLGAGPGVGLGRVTRRREWAIKAAKAGKPVVLVRVDTSPDDFEAMSLSEAIVTEVGGVTSHAAVVARSMNKPCVVGVGRGGTAPLNEGDWVLVDGHSGRIWKGVKDLPVNGKEMNPLVSKVLDWVFGELGAVPKSDRVVSPECVVVGDLWDEGDIPNRVAEFAEKAEEFGSLDRVVLDLVSRGMPVDPDDAPLFAMFGHEVPTAATELIGNLGRIVECLIAVGRGYGLVVRIPDLLRGETEETLRNLGYVPVIPARSVDAILDAGACLDVEEEFEESLGGPRTIERMMDLLVRAEPDRKVRRVPRGRDVEEAIHEALGG